MQELLEPKDVYERKVRLQKKAETGNDKLFPADLVVEGHDQHSRWFLTSLVSSVALAGQAPFTSLKTHGMLLTPKGEKMSKSEP